MHRTRPVMLAVLVKEPYKEAIPLGEPGEADASKKDQMLRMNEPV